MLRRHLLCGFGGGWLMQGPAAFAHELQNDQHIDQEDTVWPPLPASLARFSDLDATNDELGFLEPHGTEAPLPEEVVRARQVIDASPMNVTPLTIARYFVDIGSGVYGEDLRPYAGQWTPRWNPVLVEFFNATRTRPVGDTTPWCAAFVNWCLQRAGATAGGDFSPTQSASSGSFRVWGHALDLDAGETPQLGDIVVFERVDPIERTVGRGHVGFFLREDNDRILVLGGNQAEGPPRRQAINRRWFRKSGEQLQLNSYRTHARLRDARV